MIKLPLYFLCLLSLLPLRLLGRQARDSMIRASSFVSVYGKNVIPDFRILPDDCSAFVVDMPLDLNGKTLFLSSARLIVEENGFIDNGTIIGEGSTLSVLAKYPAIGLNTVIGGLWHNDKVYDTWFCFNRDPNYVSNNIINNILSLTDDSHYCEIFFLADRIYYFELPYKGPTNFGDKFSYRWVGKTKKRNYSEIYRDEYAFLRIFTIPSNTKLTIHSTFQMLPTNQGAYFVFWEYQKYNIEVTGSGQIIGDAAVHRYDSPYVYNSNYFGEWGHIFCCRACSNFHFSGITVQNSFGDCIYYSGDFTNQSVPKRYSDRLLIDGVKIRNARRNGIVVGAREVKISNTLFENCGVPSVRGTAPKSAIDFEPDGVSQYPETGNSDVCMSNCIFVNNEFDVSSTFNNLERFGKVATVVSDCIFTAPLRLNTTSWLKFSNCIIPSITNYKNEITRLCPIKHVIFDRCTIDEMPEILLAPEWNNKFYECKISRISKK